MIRSSLANSQVGICSASLTTSPTRLHSARRTRSPTAFETYSPTAAISSLLSSLLTHLSNTFSAAPTALPSLPALNAKAIRCVLSRIHLSPSDMMMTWRYDAMRSGWEEASEKEMANLRLARIERRRALVAGVAERRSSSVTSFTRREMAPVRRMAISRSARRRRSAGFVRDRGARQRTGRSEPHSMNERRTTSSCCRLYEQLKLPVPNLHQQHDVLLLDSLEDLERFERCALLDPTRAVSLPSLLRHDLRWYGLVRRSCWERVERCFERGGERVS